MRRQLPQDRRSWRMDAPLSSPSRSTAAFLRLRHALSALPRALAPAREGSCVAASGHRQRPWPAPPAGLALARRLSPALCALAWTVPRSEPPPLGPPVRGLASVQQVWKRVTLAPILRAAPTRPNLRLALSAPWVSSALRRFVAGGTSALRTDVSSRTFSADPLRVAIEHSIITQPPGTLNGTVPRVSPALTIQTGV
jgi:hypothetical protein